jgi:uncharacterized DUF497 family protein
VEFEWDDVNEAHLGWHGVEPFEAEEAFFRAVTPVVEQVGHSEERFRFEGLTDTGRRLAIVYTVNPVSRIRVITAFAP